MITTKSAFKSLSIFFKSNSLISCSSSIQDMISRTVTELSDFYADDEPATRGALVYQNLPQVMSKRLTKDVSVETPVSKCCSRFPQNVTAPSKPVDPLYVFSKWSVVCKADSAAEIANFVIDAIETAFTRKSDVSTNLNKCKVALRTTCGLEIKIKIFGLPENLNSFLVIFRKDSGDWFAFSSFFNACTKFIDSQGISMTRI